MFSQRHLSAREACAGRQQALSVPSTIFMSGVPGTDK